MSDKPLGEIDKPLEMVYLLPGYTNGFYHVYGDMINQEIPFSHQWHLGGQDGDQSTAGAFHGATQLLAPQRHGD